jgi:hypothetical protein
MLMGYQLIIKYTDQTTELIEFKNVDEVNVMPTSIQIVQDVQGQVADVEGNFSHKLNRLFIPFTSIQYFRIVQED